MKNVLMSEKLIETGVAMGRRERALAWSRAFTSLSRFLLNPLPEKRKSQHIARIDGGAEKIA